jgi:cytochrome c553
MKTICLVTATALSIAGCTNLERSRDLANPDIRPEVTAAQVCSNCHGLDGNSISPNFPRLAGQQEAYVVAQLEGFRSHQRSDPAGYEYMWGISRSLNDAQIKGLAEYFSKQSPVGNVSATEQQMAAGRKIFEQGIPEKETAPCFACHGANAEGLGAFPRLAGQHQDYLVKQLHVFQETEGRPGTPMKQITHLLSHDDMVNVAGYLQAFPGAH